MGRIVGRKAQDAWRKPNLPGVSEEKYGVMRWHRGYLRKASGRGTRYGRGNEEKDKKRKRDRPKLPLNPGTRKLLACERLKTSAMASEAAATQSHSFAAVAASRAATTVLGTDSSRQSPQERSLEHALASAALKADRAVAHAAPWRGEALTRAPRAMTSEDWSFKETGALTNAKEVELRITSELEC
jgi:hypothetical protein